ncbi:flagellar basal body rod protein FlgB [Acetobacterium bakii]|uniref:Flagellar basal body rod protein FlgB n=1 Tax=Acetobacterium bakii TaxID=52689 RepID=A0A0L6TZT3_9FIRM|nr:flagellar basal body rod protein FlgB [Acetobacterium bakii]KNZ41753.1 hypothetical protein AKG39_08945 [Acetobacterium bakii]
MIGDSITSALYQKALDGTWQRQKAISNNIANEETPGYKAVKVSFEKELDLQVKKLQSNSGTAAEQVQNINSIKNSNINAEAVTSTAARADENNVDLDAENVDMSKTTMQYYYLVRGITDNYSRLKYAISEGKR